MQQLVNKELSRIQVAQVLEIMAVLGDQLALNSESLYSLSRKPLIPIAEYFFHFSTCAGLNDE